VVPKLDRLARSVPDARDIGDALLARGVRLSLGGNIYDPADPMSKMFFNMLAVFAEFEADLLKMRTREGMAIARSRGKLKGKQPKLTARQQAELVRMHTSGDYTIADLMEVFSIGRATVYRVLDRTKTTGTTDAETLRQHRSAISVGFSARTTGTPECQRDLHRGTFPRHRSDGPTV
jgi:DNA invertase Pin-like site-specific DNA recombinase